MKNTDDNLSDPIHVDLDLPHKVLDAEVLLRDHQLGQVDVGRVEGESHREAELGVHQKGHL